MIDELVQFLYARLDEDERTVRQAASYDDGARHDIEGPEGTWVCLDESQWFGESYRGGVIAPRIGYANAPELGAHIVAHNPARVLREIDAKRRIIDRATGTRAWAIGESGRTAGPAVSLANDTLRALALLYADHPDYRVEWQPWS